MLQKHCHVVNCLVGGQLAEILEVQLIQLKRLGEDSVPLGGRGPYLRHQTAVDTEKYRCKVEYTIYNFRKIDINSKG